MDFLTDLIHQQQEWIELYPQLALAIGVLAVFLVAWISNFVLKKILLRFVLSWMKTVSKDPVRTELREKIIARTANILPAVIVSYGVTLIPHVSAAIVTVTQNVANAFIILTIAVAINTFLQLVNAAYQTRPDAARKPIKGYIQVLSIVVYAVAAILMIATLIDKSPFILLSGLGAMAAVLMLVFQDTLLSLVASMQISSGDMLRVGDWIEMPEANADGDVIDIALHTVKVQNWDKTVTSVPTRKFITNGFKNWRGMQESGGRRVKRHLLLDQQSIGFLTEEEINRLKRFSLLQEYFDDKLQEIGQWNQKLTSEGKDTVNTRRVTNIGTFRVYVQKYIENHPGVHQGMTRMVRQLQPTPEGIPLEIYMFTNTVAWVQYEGIQSDIFDHLLAILPEFGLSVYQSPSGRDIAQIRLHDV